MSVKPGKVKELADRIDAGARAIRAILAELDSSAEQMKSNWSGESQAAYVAAHKEWSAAIEAMQTILARIAKTTEGISEDYKHVDRATSHRFGA
jgi:WXG100 family type VII secretion target